VPAEVRPKMFMPHPTMSSEEMRGRTQRVWDDFYSMTSVWKRSRCAPTIRARLAFIFVSKLYRQMYATTGIATDSARRNRATRWARWLAKPCRRLFIGKPISESESGNIAADPLETRAAVIIPFPQTILVRSVDIEIWSE